MEDETGTIDATESSAPDGQADVTDSSAADTETTDVSTDQSTDAESTDDDLTWAERKGVKLDDRKAVAKMLRNADRKVSEAGRQKTTLQAAVDETAPANDPDANELASLRGEVNNLRSNFTAAQYYLDNPDDKQFDADATTILREEFQRDPEFARALGRNLPKLFDLARARHSTDSVAKAKEDGRKEERKALAGKQRASATSRAATTSDRDASSSDDFLDGFNNPWNSSGGTNYWKTNS